VTLGRVGVLVAIIATSGLLLGFGIGYPLSKINLDVRSSQQLDHVPLAGTFDPAQALVQQGDLPGNFTQSTESPGFLTLIGSPVCGNTPTVTSPLGDKQTRMFTTGADGQIVVSEVQRFRRPIDANYYIADLARAFDTCAGKTFFRGTGADRVAVKIRPGQPNPPVNDYVSYTLVPEKSGKTQVIVAFQVGDVITAFQFFGPTRPPVKLLDKVQLSILARTVPNLFGATKGVNGAVPLPTEATTSTTVLPPTSSTTSTTTTIPRKKKVAPTTLKPAAPTAAPTTRAPGQ